MALPKEVWRMPIKKEMGGSQGFLSIYTHRGI